MRNDDIKVGLRVSVDEMCGPLSNGEVIGKAWDVPLVTGWIVLLDAPTSEGERGVCLTPDLMELE